MGKWYTRQPAANLSKLVLIPQPIEEDTEDEEDYQKSWCYCNQPKVAGNALAVENYPRQKRKLRQLYILLLLLLLLLIN